MKRVQQLIILGALFYSPFCAADDLWKASAAGDLDQIEALVGGGAAINQLHPETGLSPLMEAAQNNRLDAVKRLLASGADLHAYSATGGTPLGYAGRGGDVALITFLLERGAKINAQREDGYTPLMYAANMNSPEVVRFLVDRGADVHFATPTGWTAMHVAALRDKGDNIAELVRLGGKTSPLTTFYWTPMMVAAQYGSPSAIRALLAAGASPSEGNGDINAIVAALKQRHYDCALLLVDAGASLRGSQYITAPLVYAVSNGQHALAARMIERGAAVPQYASGLYGAALGCHSACVELLCERGALLNEADWLKVRPVLLERSDVRSHIAIVRAERLKEVKGVAERDEVLAALQPAFDVLLAAHQGRTEDLDPLIEQVMQDEPWAIVDAHAYAKNEGRIDTIRLLDRVYYKAKQIAERKPRDLEALTRAAKENQPELVAGLLERGADPNFGNPKEHSPMMVAIEAGHEQIVRLLLEHGHNPNRDPGWNSRSPLAQACYRGKTPIVKLLLDAGANPDAGGDGFTPLYFAAGRGDVACIQLLRDAGAGVNLGCPGLEKRTPLIEAASKGRSEAVDLLVKLGATIQQRDELGETAMSVAAAAGHTDIVTQLIRMGVDAPEGADGLRPLIDREALTKPDRLRDLLKQGADPNTPSIRDFDTNQKMPALQALLQSDTGMNKQCLEILLDSGAELDKVPHPLGNIYRMSDGIVERLLKEGVDVNAAAPEWMMGVRPIQVVAAGGRFDLMKKLLDAGADPDLRSTVGKQTLEQVVLGFPTLAPTVREERAEKAKAVISEWRAEQANRKIDAEDRDE